MSVSILQQFEDAIDYDDLIETENLDKMVENDIDHIGSKLNADNRIDEIGTFVDNDVKIDLEDMQEGIDFWNSAIVCYLVGANPSVHVMEGLVHRIWKNLHVDEDIKFL